MSIILYNKEVVFDVAQPPECNISVFTQLLFVNLFFFRSVGTVVATQSGRCLVRPWTVLSSTSFPGSTDSFPRPRTSESYWSSSDWLLNAGAHH